MIVPPPSPRRGWRLALVGALAVLALAPSGARAQEADGEAGPPAERPGRLLVISIPGVEWSDLVRNELPAIEGFMDEAAIADLAPRSVFAPCSPITQASASTTFDLPEPFGPTMQVTPGSKTKEVG